MQTRKPFALRKITVCLLVGISKRINSLGHMAPKRKDDYGLVWFGLLCFWFSGAPTP